MGTRDGDGEGMGTAAGRAAPSCLPLSLYPLSIRASEGGSGDDRGGVGGGALHFGSGSSGAACSTLAPARAAVPSPLAPARAAAAPGNLLGLVGFVSVLLVL